MRTADLIPFQMAPADPPTAALHAGRLAPPVSSQDEAPGPHHLSGSEVAVPDADEGLDGKRIGWAVGLTGALAAMVAIVLAVAAIGAAGALFALGAAVAAHVVGAVVALIIDFGV